MMSFLFDYEELPKPVFLRSCCLFAVLFPDYDGYFDRSKPGRLFAMRESEESF
jgi:hypothetical protein